MNPVGHDQCNARVGRARQLSHPGATPGTPGLQAGRWHRPGILLSCAVVLLAAVLWLPGGRMAAQAAPPAPLALDPGAPLEARVTALMESRAAGAYPFVALQRLTSECPARVTGTPGAEAAVEWARQEMLRLGLTDVHLEDWELARGWQRGTARASLPDEDNRALSISAYGWSGSTPGEVLAEVLAVDAGRLPDEARAHANDWAGKILLLTPADPEHATRDYAGLAAFTRAAAASHAVAVIRRDPRPGGRTHTEPLAFPIDAAAGLDDIAVVDLTAADFRLLTEILRERPPLRMRLAVSNRFSAAPVRAANLVGDIRGTKLPEQVVILAAHLDAWDLGTGAVDDGAGVAAVLGAAQRLIASAAHPRRTVRFVLFTGEEQGLLGSRSYVDAHRGELDQVLAVVALDWGAGPISRLPVAGHTELLAALERFTAFTDTEPPLKVSDGYLFATDAYAFTLAGLPGLAPLQDSPDYSAVAHSADDTLDKVDALVLARNTALVAGLGLWLADSAERVGTRLTPAETARRLEAKGQRTTLELLGLWPFRD